MTIRNDTGTGLGLRHGLIGSLVAIASVVLTGTTAQAKPLEQDACTRLKLQRDALEASGARSALAERPPAQATKALDEKTQRIATLIQLDGQLRFRCNMELPIAALKPETLIEVPDTVDGEVAPKSTSPKRPAARKVKAVPASPPASHSSGQAATEQPSAASAVKTKKAAAPPEPTRPRPKPKPKIDDAFHAPPAKPNDAALPQ